MLARYFGDVELHSNRMMTLIALLAQSEYVDAMRKVAQRFKGAEGVVLHIGDSITYANPYGAWARGGRGKTPEDVEICRWMHVGADNEKDGIYLARVDRPGNRSETAVSGIRADEWLAGGKSGAPPLSELVRRFNPRMAVVMLGTNDVRNGRATASIAADLGRIVDLLTANGTIPILSTIPPMKGKDAEVAALNKAIAELVKAKRIPHVDYGGEILKRRPTDWLGTLISEDGVHPSVGDAGAEPTEGNLKSSGYLLRGWLSVRKIAEVKAKVLDRRD